ncbi:reverse transcriptase domain-containing protein [Trichonephila clavipes]|nr:reverse transcriptase domain-containing protein [Trichonephila clavipes]
MFRNGRNINFLVQDDSPIEINSTSCPTNSIPSEVPLHSNTVDETVTNDLHLREEGGQALNVEERNDLIVLLNEKIDSSTKPEGNASVMPNDRTSGSNDMRIGSGNETKNKDVRYDVEEHYTEGDYFPQNKADSEDYFAESRHDTSPVTDLSPRPRSCIPSDKRNERTNYYDSNRKYDVEKKGKFYHRSNSDTRGRRYPFTDYLTNEEITWKFIPPRSPNVGGLWEAGVKSFKHLFRRTVSEARLTLEQFITITTQIESILNSCSLTPMSFYPNDFAVLTPGYFLIGRPLQSLPEPDLTDKLDNRLSQSEISKMCSIYMAPMEVRLP